jgi:hypothetical protein
MQEALDLIALQVSSSPPRIKHLVINYVPLKEYLFSSLVNIILSSCCPETISLRFHYVLCGKPFTKVWHCLPYSLNFKWYFDKLNSCITYCMTKGRTKKKTCLAMFSFYVKHIPLMLKMCIQLSI